MTRPADDRAGAGPLDRGALVLVGILGTVLVAGYVVLASIGRDTTGYLLFLGGPAVTGIVGALVGRRVSAAAAVVEDTAEQTKAHVDERVSDLGEHLTAQDGLLGQAAQDAAVIRRHVVGPAPAVPSARAAERSPFGPVRAGIVPPAGGTRAD